MSFVFVIANIWIHCYGIQWFQTSGNFRRIWDLHLSITPTVLLRFNFPLTSTCLSFLFVSFDLSLFLLLCLPSQNGALDVPFGCSFPDKLDLRSFFMRIDSLHLRSLCNFSLCKLRQCSLSGPFCSCLFLKNCSRRRENASFTPRLFFAEVSTQHSPNDKHSSGHQIHFICKKHIYTNLYT